MWKIYQNGSHQKTENANIVSPYEDLVQLEVGNGMGIIAKFNLLSSKVQGPNKLPMA